MRFDEAQEKRILAFIGNLTDEIDILDAWATKIEQSVIFPFQGKVSDWQERNSIVQQGDILKVHSIDNVDDKYGIIVNTRFGRKKIFFPLLELEPLQLDEEQKTLLNDYNVWFSNR